MRPPVTHPPVQPPLPMPHEMSADSTAPSLDWLSDMASEPAPVIDWPEFADDAPPLQERRRR